MCYKKKNVIQPSFPVLTQFSLTWKEFFVKRLWRWIGGGVRRCHTTIAQHDYAEWEIKRWKSRLIAHKKWWRWNGTKCWTRKLCMLCARVLVHTIQQRAKLQADEWRNERIAPNSGKRNNRIEQIHENSNNQKFINHLSETNLLIRWIFGECFHLRVWFLMYTHRQWVCECALRLTHSANVYARQCVEMIDGKWIRIMKVLYRLEC